MNKIQQLIQQYCPNGVEFKELKEIAEIGTGSSNGNESTEDGQYPLFVRSKFIKKIDSFEFDEEAIIIPGEGGIGDIFHYINGKYALHQRAYRIHLLINYVTTKFIYYYMIANFKEFILQKAVNATVSSIRKPMIEKFQIPIPPLPIQQEIVTILDSFTQLEAELEAELEARRAQYEYYRNKLLSATELNGKWLMNDVEVEWKTLGEVGKICMCKRVMKHETKSEGDIPFYKIGTFGKEADAYISNELYNDYKSRFNFPNVGEVLISASGTIGRTVIYDGKPAYFQDSNIVWISNDESMVTNKFLFHYYKIVEWKTDGGTISRLYNDNLAKTKIPIPPLAEQERIVGMLDKFDSLVNDISIGLPAEIDGRRKQYNYYRGKLLDFIPVVSDKRLVVNENPLNTNH